ncbi:CoB--CoM heterodisulfide reductase iron-sulfur subunit B family protein [Candidatus Methanocrinis natronophilus]|uniref:CoB--CoM heterodisulfide reductase iron-sulfur subunit B family protein n=1 Tax=Candidatus Methanocrinis natronophilus TaxID=3033396 RepID=A0ABT5X919_9EURY|nr:CoB--CoM heterodisulfide reductase iron-sulfur subunit B family protein [Candidatus Methanocrinis natronophilus]MDF0591175.1 CoB--CoM heterodisulfide reductase iron-sulfur subunit B family protein [Candidatus Methanocrinis natronophilus]
MKLAYYPGCVARSTGREYEISTRAVSRALGIELEEIDDWNCCGATHVSNELVSTALAARNLVRTDLPVMASCSICYSRLRAAMIHLKDRKVRKKVNEALERKYEGEKEVLHVIEPIGRALRKADEMDQDLKKNKKKNGRKEKDLIVRPLAGLKAAPYYGCLLTRPGGGIDSPENPKVLEDLIRTLGAEPTDFRLKMKCCCGPIFMPEEEAAAETLIRILRNARASGADFVVALCPLCHLMLDANQPLLEKKFGEEINLPILYVTQMAGLALGLGPEELGMEMNSVSTRQVLEKLEKIEGKKAEEEGAKVC